MSEASVSVTVDTGDVKVKSHKNFTNTLDEHGASIIGVKERINQSGDMKHLKHQQIDTNFSQSCCIKPQTSNLYSPATSGFHSYVIINVFSVCDAKF
jgi:hypothetical protein